MLARDRVKLCRRSADYNAKRWGPFTSPHPLSAFNGSDRCKIRQHHPCGIIINLNQMEEKKAIKVAFFKEIYALDEPDDETEDTAGISEILRDSKKAPSPELPQRRGRSNLRGNAHNPVSAEKVAEPFPPAAILEPPPTNGQTLTKEKAMHSSEVNISRTKNIATAAGGKRKRGDGLEIPPEARQLFKGLAFCLSP